MEENKPWIILKKGTREMQGPFSEKQVRKMLEKGALCEKDFLWRDGFKEWTLVLESEAFSSFFKKKLSKQKDGSEQLSRESDLTMPEGVLVCPVTEQALSEEAPEETVGPSWI